MYTTFEDWTQGRALTSLGTNSGSLELPFQNWRNFKEAFAPELVARAVQESRIPVTTCLDPFGGSGTTALACQFLGVYPIIAEVNPYLADLIEAKLALYDPDALADSLGRVIGSLSDIQGPPEDALAHVPPTFIEPGVKGRWIFDRTIATRISAFLGAINRLADASHRRLFRVLLGGILTDVSNVVTSGKGRRYRRRWQNRRRDQLQVDLLFCDAAQRAIADVHRYSRRKQAEYKLLRGDSRTTLRHVDACDLAVFSPPYPNSFDYTDVYNVELWTLGYLQDGIDNQILRASTLSSHVQISRDFASPPGGSPLLRDTMACLLKSRSSLWDPRIPDMVSTYFADLMTILKRIKRSLSAEGSAWMVVGDSRYAGIHIRTATILAELACRSGWSVSGVEPFRSMRVSAQQGGNHELAETLVVLCKQS